MLILKLLRAKNNLAVCFLIFGFFFACGENPNVKKGREFIEIGDFEKAAESFEAAIQEQPKNADAHYLLGLVHYDHLRNQRKAINEYELAIKSGLSNAVEKFTARADTFIAKNMWHDAAIHLRMAIKADSTNATLYFRLGEVLSNTYQNREMAEAFLKALKLSDDEQLFQKICEIQKIKIMLRIHPIASGGWNQSPVYSPDEKKIAWIKDPTGSPNSMIPSLLSLYMMDADGSNQKLVHEDSGWDTPSFSGDGNRIITERKLFDLIENKFIPILLPKIFPEDKKLSSDGSHILFYSFFAENQGIYLYSIASQEYIRITSDYDSKPCFLPSGKKIVFIENYDIETARSGSGKSIGIVEIDGKNRRTIYSAPEDKAIFRLLPTKDGKSIIFYYSRDPRTFKVDIDGKNLKEIDAPSPITDINMDASKALMVYDGRICEFELNTREYTRNDIERVLQSF